MAFFSQALAEALGEVIATATITGTRLQVLSHSKTARRAATQTETALRERIKQQLAAIRPDMIHASSLSPTELDRLVSYPEFSERLTLWMAAIRTNYSTTDARQLMEHYLRDALPDHEQATSLTAILDTYLRGPFRELLGDPKLGSLIELTAEQTALGILTKQLAVLPHLLELINSLTEERKADLGQLEARHRAAMLAFTSHIRPPDFTERRQVTLDEIYVVPTLRADDLDSLDALVNGMRKRRPAQYVVLGDPGAGKTTLAVYIARQIVSRPPSSVATVVIVPLRVFEERRAKEPVSISRYIAEHEAQFRQVVADPLDWEAILRLGRCAVIFDGLDELLDVSRRSEMADLLEAFTTLYPATPVLVTCRSAGYLQAALSRDLFAEAVVQPFNNKQVAEYARRWFCLQGNAIPDYTGRQSADLFLAESAGTAELRENPLLLSLLCVLYRQGCRIPEDLSEVYAQCTELLLATWDMHRRINIPTMSHRLRTLLYRLSWWIYENDLNEPGITEGELREFCVAQLLKIKAADEDGARSIAADFIAHCSGRAWVFSDAGSSDTKHRRFKFTDRTFLEYFAGVYVATELLPRHPKTGIVRLLKLVVDRPDSLVPLLALQSLRERADLNILKLLLHLSTAKYQKYYLPSQFLLQVVRTVDLHEDTVRQLCEFLFARVSMGRDSDVRKVVAGLLSSRDENVRAAWAFLRGHLSGVELDADLTEWRVLAAVRGALTHDVRALIRGDVEELVEKAEGELVERLARVGHFDETMLAFVGRGVIQPGALASRMGREMLLCAVGPASRSILEVCGRSLSRGQFEAETMTAFSVVEDLSRANGTVTLTRDDVAYVGNRIALEVDSEMDLDRLAGCDHRFDSIPLATRLLATTGMLRVVDLALQAGDLSEIVRRRCVFARRSLLATIWYNATLPVGEIETWDAFCEVFGGLDESSVAKADGGPLGEFYRKICLAS